MIVYRITHDVRDQLTGEIIAPAEDLSGTGAARVGGRWNSPGVPALYTAINISLALLEILAHLRVYVPSLKLVRVLLADELAPALRELPRSELPGGWNADEHNPKVRACGDRLLRNTGTLGFFVPSKVNSYERNLVLNPLHREYSGVSASVEGPIDIDRRLFER